MSLNYRRDNRTPRRFYRLRRWLWGTPSEDIMRCAAVQFSPEAIRRGLEAGRQIQMQLSPEGRRQLAALYGSSPIGIPVSSAAAELTSTAVVRSCRSCGCTDDRACEGGCWWVGPDLCSACEDDA